MKLWEILKSVGSGVLASVIPGAGAVPAILGAVNAMLSDDDKLPADATGDQVSAAISKLPPDQQAQVMVKEFDVDITQIKESYSTVRTMLETDAQNPQSTRPWVVKWSFVVVAVIHVSVVLIWGYGVVQAEKKDIIKNIMDGWPFIVALTLPFCTLLRAYFGVLKDENRTKYNAANGASTPGGLEGILAAVFKRKKG